MKYLLKIAIAVMLLFTLQLTGEEPIVSVNSDQFIQIPQKELRKFTGIYCNEKSDVIRIKQKDGKLFFINSMYEKQELKAVSSTKFLLDKSSPQAYYEFSLKKNKVEKFVTQDFKRNTKSEFIKISHFTLYGSYYIIGLIVIILLIVMLNHIKKRHKWMADGGMIIPVDNYNSITDIDDITGNDLDNDLVVTNSPRMDKLLDRDNWLDKLLDRISGKTKK